MKLVNIFEAPVVSAFDGIKIQFFYNEHEPEDHFRVQYGEYVSNIIIETLETRDGYLPPKIYKKIYEWGKKHRNELFLNWRRAQRHQPLKKIKGP